MQDAAPDPTSAPSARTSRGRECAVRLLVLAGIVSFGLAQPVFGMIQTNPVPFPTDALFCFWVIFWTFVVPLLLLFGTETLLLRFTKRDGKLFRGWRAFLYTALVFSLLRQGLVAYLPSVTLGPGWLQVPVILLVGGGLGVLFARIADKIERYLSLVGLISPVLLVVFAIRMGVVEEEWRVDQLGAIKNPLRTDVPPVLVILFDELSLEPLLKNGAFDEETYPHFSRLAKESAWFPDAITNDIMTKDAVPTLLSGASREDNRKGSLLHRVRDRYEVVFSSTVPGIARGIHRLGDGEKDFVYLGRNALGTQRPLSVPRLILSGLARSELLPPPFDQFVLERIEVQHSLYHSDHVQLLLDLVESGESEGRFIFWHLGIPHAPFVLDSEGRPHGDPNVTLGPKTKDPARARANYLKQVALADAILGRILGKLRDAGLYDRIVLAVTSDHGLRTSDMLSPETSKLLDHMEDVTIRVPLFLRAPSLKPGAREGDYQHMDFAPTMLDLLGYDDDPAPFEGRSILGPPGPPRPRICRDVRRVPFVRDPETGLWLPKDPAGAEER